MAGLPLYGTINWLNIQHFYYLGAINELIATITATWARGFSLLFELKCLAIKVH